MILFIFISFFFNLFIFPSSSSSSSSLILNNKYNNNITITGLFSYYYSNGTINKSQLEHLSVFLQAINEINNNPNILPYHYLQYTIGNGMNSLEISSSLNNILKNKIISGVVSALNNDLGSLTTKILSENNILTVNSMTYDTTFGDPDKYPIKAQTNPIISFQGMVLQNILCELNLTRIITFTTDDINGMRFATELSDQTYCTINLLAEYTFPSYTTDFTDILLDAIDTGTTIFVILMNNPINARYLLQQAHELGLFRENTQVFLPTIDGLSEAFSDLKKEKVKDILEGIVTLTFIPDYSVNTTSRGKEFYLSWLNQKTLGNCSTQVDSMGNYYLSHTQTYSTNNNNNNNNHKTCISLDFNSYHNGQNTLDSYVSLTYDATYALAWTLHKTILKSLPLNGINLRNTIIDEVEFIGASGYVDIFEGMNEYGGIARGDREVGLNFELLNFHPNIYDLNGNGFVPFAIASVEEGIISCPKSYYCIEPIFHSSDGKWPSAFPPYAFSTAPSIVKIGGLFSVFIDGTDKVNLEQSEFLSIFLMAINEINNKTDGIHDNLLFNTQLKLAVVNSVTSTISGANAYTELTNSFYNSGVSAIVNSLDSSLVKSMNSYSSEDQLFNVYSYANSSSIADGIEYPYKASIMPLENFIGTVFQGFLCQNKLYKIAILSEDSVFGSKSSTDLLNIQSYNNDCEFDILSSITLSDLTTDYSSILKEVSKSGVRIFVIFASPSITSRLLLQGTKLGIFKTGTLILTSESKEIAYQLEVKHSASKKLISSILKGVISAELIPDYNLMYSDVGKLFYERFLKYNEKQMITDSTVCDIFDDSGERLLYLNSETGTGCAQLNYSAYVSGSLKLGKYASMVYDATYALAYAIDSVLSKSQSLTGDNIRNSMYNSVSFEGASGNINISQGITKLLGCDQGNRMNGIYYRLLNFNIEMFETGQITGEYEYVDDDIVDEELIEININNEFQQNNKLESELINDGFITFGIWSVENGIQSCPKNDENFHCYNVIYNNKPFYKVPDDSREDIILVFSTELRIFFYILGGLLILEGLFFFILTFRLRDLPEVKNSQEYLLYCIIFGCILAGGRVINSALPLNDNTCLSGLWLSNLSYWFVLMAFYLKSWRINQLLGVKSIKRVKITTKQIMSYMLFSVIFLLIMLIILTQIGKPFLAKSISENQNQKTKIPFCGMVHPEVQTTLFVVHTILLVLGLRICWSIREVPKKFSDFHVIGSAKVIIAIISIFVMPCVYLIGLRHDVSSAIATTAFGIGGITVLSIVFGVKFYGMFGFRRITSKVLDETYKESIQSANQVPNLSPEILRTMDSDEQYAYYTLQIKKYTMLRMRIDASSAEKSCTTSQRPPSHHASRDFHQLEVSKSHKQNIQQQYNHNNHNYDDEDNNNYNDEEVGGGGMEELEPTASHGQKLPSEEYSIPYH